MKIIETYTSPDNLLEFMIAEEGKKKILGFKSGTKFSWHIHSDMLLNDMPSEDDACRKFADNLLNDKAIIMVSTINGIRDFSIIDDPVHELSLKAEDEEIEFRYWSGRRFKE